MQLSLGYKYMRAPFKDQPGFVRMRSKNIRRLLGADEVLTIKISYLGGLIVCNIAAYVGSEHAAPRLIDMMRRQEGFNGGFYTGIATLDDSGRLHHAKVIGDVEELVTTTQAANLPGRVGIIHSRTPSGGDREWAHPFVGTQEQMAYVANGSMGQFLDVVDQDAIANELAVAGYPYLARSAGAIGAYPRLADGTCVHVSEVMCRLIESLTAQGYDAPAAMREGFVRFPAEIVGLLIHTELPESVVAARINQPLMIARLRHGWAVASTALAFDVDEVKWTMPMPPASVAVFTMEGIRIESFDVPIPVAEEIPWEKGRHALLELLADGTPRTLAALRDATANLWPSGRLAQAHMMLYELIRSMHHAGVVSLEHHRIPGAKEAATPITAPQTRVRLGRS